MFLSAVIDPLAFSAYAKNKEHREQVRNNFAIFIARMDDRGILLLDDKGKIQEELKKLIKHLPPEIRKIYTIWIEETAKGKRLINVDAGDHIICNEAYTLAKKYAVDIFLTGNVTYPSNIGIKIPDYQFGEIESRIHDNDKILCNQLQFDSESDPDIVRNAIIRCFKYSKTIKLFDKQIGKNIQHSTPTQDDKKHLERFYEGIEYVIDIWNTYSCMNTKTREVRIYTVYDERNLSPKRGRVTPFDVLKNLEDFLRKKLAERFPLLDIKLELHNDKFGKYHARFLKSDYAIAQIDRGFDLFYKRNGQKKFKDNEISLKNSHYKTGYAGKPIAILPEGLHRRRI